MINNPPLVSVCCITYNHRHYLRQCFDGFIMQNTKFTFEIIVHDDASTDGTQDIVKEYAMRYPKLFKVIIQEENQYSQGVNVFNNVFSCAAGKYIAICEGDDYWIDPLKLQKQVDFLESNQSYSMCFTNAIQHFEDNSEIDKPFFEIKDKDYSGTELFANWCVPTASILLRKDIVQSNLYKKASNNSNFVFKDILIILTCATLGKVKAIPLFTTVYRRTSCGALALQDSTTEGQLAYIKHIIEIPIVFGNTYKDDSDRIVVLQYYSLARKAFFQKQLYNMCRFIGASMSFSLKRTIRLYIKKIFHV